MNPFAIVPNGPSSAGKTSIARAIQSLAGTPVLHASLDTFTDMFHWPAIPDGNEKGECHRFGVANFHATLPLLASSRFPVVIDHVFERRDWLEATQAALSGKRVYFVAVRCPIAVLEERERSRGDRRVGMARSQVDRVHVGVPYATEVDTSTHSPEECADAILRFVEQAEAAVSS